jgi:hypothetical protein
MLNNVSRTQVIGAWFAVVVVMFALSVVWGATPNLSAVEIWLVACLAPPAVLWFVWRAPAVTIAEVLFAANNSEKDGQA